MELVWIGNNKPAGEGGFVWSRADRNYDHGGPDGIRTHNYWYQLSRGFQLPPQALVPGFKK